MSKEELLGVSLIIVIVFWIGTLSLWGVDSIRDYEDNQKYKQCMVSWQRLPDTEQFCWSLTYDNMKPDYEKLYEKSN